MHSSGSATRSVPTLDRNHALLAVCKAFQTWLARACRGVEWVAKLCKCNGAGWPLAKQACILASIPSGAFSRSEGGGPRCLPLPPAELGTQTSSLSRGRSKMIRKLQRGHIWVLKNVCLGSPACGGHHAVANSNHPGANPPLV